MRPPVLLLTADSELAGVFEADPQRPQYELTVRSGAEESSEQIARRYLVVVLDYRTIDEARALGPALRLLNPSLEFLAIVGSGNERDAVDALRRGAFDYSVWDPDEPVEPLGQLHRCMRRFLEMAPSLEHTRFGPYLLVKKLGAGGMAEVFLAREEKRERRLVVVKKMRPDLVGRSEFENMFMDEARISSQLDHPNIVHVLDVGRIEDELFISMEYIRGTNLQHLGEALAWKFRPEVAAYIVAEVCAGLDYSHRLCGSDGRPLNIIHRDINPPNVLISTRGQVKLFDFGIAKAEERYTETLSGVVKGKISWLSPEQARGLPIDQRSDVFGVGVVLYVLLTGVHPFHEGARARTLRRIREAEAEPLDLWRSDLPPVFQELLDKVLTADPAQRLPTAHDVEAELRRYLLTAEGAGPQQLAAVMAGFPGLLVDEAMATATSASESLHLPLDADSGAPASTAVVGVPAPREPQGGEEASPTPVAELHTDLGEHTEPAERVDVGERTDPAEDTHLGEVTDVGERTDPAERTVVADRPTPTEPAERIGVEQTPAELRVSEHTEPGAPVPPRPTPPRDTGTDQVPIFPEAARKRSWTPWIVAGVASIALGSSIGWWSLHRGTGGPPTADIQPTAARTEPSAAATTAVRPTPPTATAADRTPTRVAVRSPAPTLQTPQPRSTRAVTPKTGTVSIWVDPWAYVSVNGRRLDVVAPVKGIRLPAGRHRITLENPALSIRRDIDVVVRPGEESKISLRLE